LLSKSPSFLEEKFSVSDEGNRDYRVVSLLAMTEGWIPACAGMTEREAGMTEREAGM
jgi:hypothetical protein